MYVISIIRIDLFADYEEPAEIKQQESYPYTSINPVSVTLTNHAHQNTYRVVLYCCLFLLSSVSVTSVNTKRGSVLSGSKFNITRWDTLLNMLRGTCIVFFVITNYVIYCCYIYKVTLHTNCILYYCVHVYRVFHTV